MKFLLCSFLLLQVPVIYGKLGKSPTDGRHAANEFVKQTHQSLVNADLGAFITALATVAAFVPGPAGIALFATLSIAGMVVTALSGTSHQFSPENDLTRNQDVKLTEIAAQLKDVDNALNDCLKTEHLGQKRRDIANLQEFGKSVGENNEILKIRFGDMCRVLGYSDFSEFFAKELIGKNENSKLAEQYLIDFDRKNYLKFASGIMLHFSEAANLQYTCAEAIDQNHTQLNYSLARLHKTNGQLFEDMEKELINVESFFQKYVFDHAMSFVENYTLEHKAKNAIELFSVIYKQLLSKYYWKRWFLMVRDDISGAMHDSKNNEPIQENMITWYKRWDNLSGKTIILASSKLNFNSSEICQYNTGCKISFEFPSCSVRNGKKNACYVCSGCDF